MRKIVDTTPQPPLLVKQKQTLLVIAILLVLLPISMWAVNQMTPKPPKATSLPLGSIRVNPEQIVTDLGGNTIFLSALAYDTGGSPISSGISYQWGFSTTNSIGIFTPNGTTNLASFKPSITVKGRGDIWVRAFGVNGQTATKSIPVYVGVVPEITLLDSVRINPEKIDTVRNAPSIHLSALAYKNGAPVWDGISYEWGMSTISPIGQLILNSNTKLASFEPSHSATGAGDLWVRASDEGGHSAIRSIPVIVGYPVNTPSPTLPITTSAPIPTSTPTPTPIVCLPADINKDGKVNGNDLTIVFTNMLKTTPSPVRADINIDGIVDITDYSILVRDYNLSTGACQ